MYIWLGADIQEGNKTLTLALLWQLMRSYTLSLLSRLNTDGTPIVENEIVSWANNRLQEAGKEVSITGFQVRASLHCFRNLNDGVCCRINPCALPCPSFI